MRAWCLAGGLPWLLALWLAAAPAGADPPLPEGNSAGLLQRYAAGWDLDALLAEPPVAREWQALPEEVRTQVLRNLSVTGPIDVYAGALSVMGNAPHRGGEDEALLCVEVGGSALRLHAAIFASGRVTVYTRGTSYGALPICVRDWVALVSTGHRYRLQQPANLQLVRPPPP